MAATSVASAVRGFLRAEGVAVGVRGRLSTEAFVSYFLANPRTAREIAAEVGVSVPARGRLSAEAATALATAVR